MLIYFDFGWSLLYITSTARGQILTIRQKIKKEVHPFKKKKKKIVFFPALFFFVCSLSSHFPSLTRSLHFKCPSFFPALLFFSFPFCFSPMSLFKPLQFVLANSPSRRRMCSTDWGLGGHSCPITNWFINLLQPACIEILFCLLALVVTYSQQGRLFVFVAVHP